MFTTINFCGYYVFSFFKPCKRVVARKMSKSSKSRLDFELMCRAAVCVYRDMEMEYAFVKLAHPYSKNSIKRISIF